MQTNRLTVLGAVTASMDQLDPAKFKHVELLEQSPGRWAMQFESTSDLRSYLIKLSRRKPGLTFLWEYERSRIKGLVKLSRGKLIGYEIGY